MAIKISGTTVINDDSNIINVGIVTVGTGGTDGKIQVGTGATIYGSGDVAIAGTVYAFDVVLPLKIDSFSPSNGGDNVSIDTDIRITFNKAIGIGSTGFVRLDDKTGNVDTFGVGSTYISRADLNKTLVITPSAPFTKGLIGVGNSITVVVDASVIDNSEFTGLSTTGSDITYKFFVQNIGEGDAFEGGYLICASGGTQWIVSPLSAEVSRDFTLINDSNTRSQAESGCSGWFVPDRFQLSNPGYVCRTYWDSYSLTAYYSSNGAYGLSAWTVNFVTGSTNQSYYRTTPRCVRSFRTVSY